MKITCLDTTEEMVLNPKYFGWRVARIEAWTDEEKWPYEVGRIEVFENDELFDQVQEVIREISTVHKSRLQSNDEGETGTEASGSRLLLQAV